MSGELYAVMDSVATHTKSAPGDTRPYCISPVVEAIVRSRLGQLAVNITVATASWNHARTRSESSFKVTMC